MPLFVEKPFLNFGIKIPFSFWILFHTFYCILKGSLCFPDGQVYLSVAADVVFTGIDEPTRFVIETKAKIYPTNERFWYFSKRVLSEQFYLRLKEVKIHMCLSYM